MRALIQLATWAALAVDVASIVMLYWSAESAAMDAAGSGMASGLLWLAVAAAVAAFLLLLVSYWRRSAGVALLALIIALVPAVPIVLPTLQ
jgi:hypothetical protein